MARNKYHGYIIDRDDLGRLYIYCLSSHYSEEADRNYNCGNTIKEAKETIDKLLSKKEDSQMPTLTEQEVYEILDRRIKQEMDRKNEYIEKNGFKNPIQIRSFDSAIATLTGLYYTFHKEFFKTEGAKQ